MKCRIRPPEFFWTLLCLLLLALPRSAQGRDAGEIGDWLCSRVFEAPGAVLALACDGFFGLRLSPGDRPQQDITGLWRLDPNGIDLSLYNMQDRQMGFSVGKDGIHGGFAGMGQMLLRPATAPAATFPITGLLEKNGASAFITDAASGRTFALTAPPEAESGKFAGAEISIEGGKALAGDLLFHSRPVPRLFSKPPARDSMQVFNNEVAGRYWLVPALPGIRKAVLRLAPAAVPDREEASGAFDVTGPGLRFEGTYAATQGKLTLSCGNASLKNLKLMGAEQLGDLLLGEHAWRLLPRGLELDGKRRLLLLAHQP